MAYWWVSQNKTYLAERAGGYLWAPLVAKGGNAPHHWMTMSQVQPGDVIFSYYRQAIVAVATATSASFARAKPSELNPSAPRGADGRMVSAAYRDLPTPLPIADIRDQLIPLLPDRYSPLNRSGTGNEGYLFRLPPRAGRLLLDTAERDQENGSLIADGLSASAPTERDALIRSRIGQGRFRYDLLEMWEGRCCITGLDIDALLRASHIKPWRDSNNAERLDPYNGLLLSPGYDAAFDKGLITLRLMGE